ncbi:MAG TPA: hypothetical protein VHN74_10760 [Candidatus Angelobacter sp.]|jgi:hypothetical protein|nr:hypothetical protein [Candidatus Angelobacter sp.]
MRSEYVLAAVKEIGNRFMLCRVTSVSARRLHVDSTRSSETINKSLNLFAAGDTTTKTASDAHAALAEPVATHE